LLRLVNHQRKTYYNSEGEGRKKAVA